MLRPRRQDENFDITDELGRALLESAWGCQQIIVDIWKFTICLNQYVRQEIVPSPELNRPPESFAVGYPSFVSDYQKKQATPFLEDGHNLKGYPMIEPELVHANQEMTLVDAYIMRGVLPSFD